MGARKRILMVMASPFRSGMAPENYIRAKAVYDNPEYEIDIMCFPVGEDVIQDNVHILRVPKKKLFKSFQVGEYKKILVYTILMTLKLAFKKDKKYEVIFLFNASYLFFWFIKPLYKGKVVATIYAPLAGEMTKWKITGSRFFFRFLKNTEQFMLGKYDRLVFNIEKMKSFYESAGYNPAKSVLILHACEKDKGRALVSPGKKSFTILYAGSFVKVQNLDLLYNLAANLKDHPDIRFILIGATDPEYVSESRKIEALSLTNVELQKRVNQSQLETFYQDADVLISCRVEGEDLPFKIIEYMSMGKCIFATDLPIHNLVLNHTISCLVEPDAERMANEILDLVRHPERIEKYEKNMNQHFEEYHSLDIMKSKYKELIEELSTAI